MSVFAGCASWIGDSTMTSWCPMAAVKSLFFKVGFELASFFGGEKAG